MSTEIKQEENKNNNCLNQELIALSNENFMNETYNKFNSIIYNSDELNKFKDNILSLLKERDKLYLEKLVEYKIKSEKIKVDYDSMNKIANSKFSKIIENEARMSSRLDQLDSYESFVSKTNDKLISHEVRLTNIRDDFSNATQKYDKIYLDNLELPGYIGRCAKYKNCQIFFLEVIKDLAKLNKYKEKNSIDLKMYKDKLETIISSMNSILDNNNQSQIKYINETKEKILKDCNNMFESVCENMKEIRIENSKYSVDLISQSMDLSKKWDKIEKIRDDLLEKFNYSVNKYQMLTEDTIKSFDEFKTEYSIIRRKFMELAEFIKDVRFRKNIGENVKKKEIKSMVKKMLKKRKSFESKDVHLLNDISSIENIDYKKYYNVEIKNDDINNDENNSMKLSKNKKTKNSKMNLFQNKKKKNYSLSREGIYKKDLNQSAESHRVKIKNPLASSTNLNYAEQSAKSINITPINVKNLKNNNNINNSAIVGNRNNTINYKKENSIDIKYRKEMVILKNNNDSNKNKNKDEEYIKEQIENTKLSKEKIKEYNNINENNNKNIKEKSNEIEIYKKTNENINDKSNKINFENKNNNQDEKQNMNNKKEKDIIQNDKIINQIVQSIKPERGELYIEKENISLDNNSKENINNINNNKGNTKIKQDEFNSINKDKSEMLPKNLGNNDENSQISLSRIRSFKSNLEVKPSIADDSSSISDGYTINSVKNNKNNIIGLSSEKTLSFVSDNNNNNNINKFLINDVQIENNDRIIKELASELEQSTAKKDKLESNKKEIEQKFKKVCNNIEPINLLGKQKNNLKISSNPNENIIYNQNIKNNDYNSNNNIKNKEFKEQIINNNINDNNENQKEINNNSNINTVQNEVHETKTREEDKNYDMNLINIKQNNNEMHKIAMKEEENNKILNQINKNVNESCTNLNPIKVNNEIYINEGMNHSLDKKLHSFDQKLLNLELYTKEKILDLFSQINLLKHTCKLPIDNSFLSEKSNLHTNKITYISNKTPSNPKYKTFNSSFMNNSNMNSQQNPFHDEKNKENISSNLNENKNLININNNNNSNSLYIFNNINIEKKKYSLKEINPKTSILNQKMAKNNLNGLNYNMNNITYLNNIRQNNSLTENNNGIGKIISKNGNIKEFFDGNNNKIIQKVNSDITHKFFKDNEKKNDNEYMIKYNNNNNEELCGKNSNKSLNNGSNNKNNFAFSNSTFKGTEIKLVDLNKLVNQQLPRNKLIPIKINDNEYFTTLNSK